ncbi:MAG: cyclase family protein [Solirubrobacterales bacterium]|nr:cyclase family protein [Solirubrobacterales bacterium]
MKTVALLVVGLIIGGGAVALFKGSGDEDKADSSNPLGISKVVGLSQPISEDIPLWPGDPKVRFKEVANFKDDGYFLREFSIGEHSATHMNAPNSFHEGGAGMDAYRDEDLIKSAVVIDVRKQAAANPDYALTKQDLEAWEEENGEVPEGSVVLLDTGWSEKWDDPKAFFGFDAKGNMHFPGFGGDTTRFLLDQRKIAGVGIDTHGVDPSLDENYTTNTEVLRKNRIVLENLTNLDQLPATGSTIVIGALRLKGGSGTPAEVFGLVP